MLKKGGDVEVNINIISSDKAYKVKLKDKRFIDRKTVNLINNQVKLKLRTLNGNYKHFCY